MLDVLLITALCCLVLFVPLSRALNRAWQGGRLARIWSRIAHGGTDGFDDEAWDPEYHRPRDAATERRKGIDDSP